MKITTVNDDQQRKARKAKTTLSSSATVERAVQQIDAKYTSLSSSGYALNPFHPPVYNSLSYSHLSFSSSIILPSCHSLRRALVVSFVDQHSPFRDYFLEGGSAATRVSHPVVRNRM